jgi:hypothetical protein
MPYPSVVPCLISFPFLSEIKNFKKISENIPQISNGILYYLA